MATINIRDKDGKFVSIPVLGGSGSGSGINETVTPAHTNFIYEETQGGGLVEAENLFDADIVSSNYTGGCYLASTGAWYVTGTFFSTNLIPVSNRPVTLYIYGLTANSDAHITLYGSSATEETPTAGVVGNGNSNPSGGFIFNLNGGSSWDGILTSELSEDSNGTPCFKLTFKYDAVVGATLAYFRFGFKTSYITAGGNNYSSIYICNGERYTGTETTTIYRFNNKISAEDINGLSIEPVEPENQWEGKNWTALGTSITSVAQGKYVTPLAELSGLIATNQGVPGSVMGGHILYYAQKASSLATADIVTIEGSVNDFASANPLGKVGDTVPYFYEFTSPVWENGGTEEGTFAGACYQVFKAVLENAPNAVVICLTDTVGRDINTTGAYYGREKRNSLDLSQKDYNDMLKAVAEYMGVIVIDTATLSGITQENPDYYVDHIHHSDLGGRQFAQTAWSKIKTIPNKLI